MLPSAVLMASDVLEKKMSSSQSPKWDGAHVETRSAGLALGGTDKCPCGFEEHLLVFVVQQGCRCWGPKKSTQTWETCSHRYLLHRSFHLR